MNERLKAYSDELAGQAPSSEELDRRLERAQALFDFVNDTFIKRELAKEDPLHAVISEVRICDLLDETTGGKDSLWVQNSTNKPDEKPILFRKRVLQVDQDFLEADRNLYFTGPDVPIFGMSAYIRKLVNNSFPGFSLRGSKRYDYGVENSDNIHITICITQQLDTPEDLANLYGSQIESVIVSGIENLLIPQTQ